MEGASSSNDDTEPSIEWVSWRANSAAYATTLKPHNVIESRMTSVLDFNYRALNTAQIRLLHLSPRTSNLDHDGKKHLSGSIEHVSRDNAPPYAALSYTWGDPDKVGSIFLDGQTFKIGKSLSEALEHLQDGSKTLTLWIDAICINQDDEDEKSKQVNQMASIYRQAALVIAWLGPAADDSLLALRKLFKLGRSVFSSFRDTGNFEADQERWKILRGLTVSQLTIGDNEDVDVPVTAIVRLFQRPWWQRLWIVQEMALAKSVLFVCGPDEISSMYLQQGYFSVLQLNLQPVTDTQISTGAYLELLVQLDKRPIAMLNACHGGLMYRNKPLVELLSNTCMLSATNPQDRIFGLLGLSSDAADLNIYADYSKSPETIYTDTVTALLCSGDLKVLSSVQHPRLLGDMPTWVADFSDLRRGNMIIQAKVAPITERYSAGMGQLPPVGFVRQHGPTKVLSLAGVFVGEVTRIGRFPVSDDSPLEQASTYLAGFESFARSQTTAYGSEEGLSEAIWRVPIGNVEYNAINHEDRSGKPGAALHQCYKAVRGVDVPADKENPEDWRLRNGMPYIREMMERIKNKVTFVSSSGYLGFGTKILQEGDQIVLFYGAEVPYLLRPTDNGWFMLVGEVYVHGIMYGEFLRDNRVSMMLELV